MTNETEHKMDDSKDVTAMTGAKSVPSYYRDPHLRIEALSKAVAVSLNYGDSREADESIVARAKAFEDFLTHE